MEINNKDYKEVGVCIKMSDITITFDTIKDYVEVLSNPAKYGFKFLPIYMTFEKSDELTKNDELHNEYIKYTNIQIPKIFFYMIMDSIFGFRSGKDEFNNKGFYLKLKKWYQRIYQQ